MRISGTKPPPTNLHKGQNLSHLRVRDTWPLRPFVYTFDVYLSSDLNPILNDVFILI